MENRYDHINAAWNAVKLPPVTREEATRGLAILCRKFGGTQHGGPSMARPYRSHFVRACWVTRKGGTLDKGWPRLVHDVSHDIFRARHPQLKPHQPAHAAVERELTQYVLSAGWLDGKLATVRTKPTRDEKLSARRTSLTERLARWLTKEKRAANAAKKLRAQLKALDARERRAVINKAATRAAELIVEPKPVRAKGSYPFTFTMHAAQLVEFGECEFGAHEDGNQKRLFGVSAYEVLRRHKTRVEIRDHREAKLIHYAAALGTFEVRYPRGAQRVVDLLREEFGPSVTSYTRDGEV
jgi:hypothetical protein